MTEGMLEDLAIRDRSRRLSGCTPSQIYPLNGFRLHRSDRIIRDHRQEGESGSAGVPTPGRRVHEKHTGKGIGDDPGLESGDLADVLLVPLGGALRAMELVRGHSRRVGDSGDELNGGAGRSKTPQGVRAQRGYEASTSSLVFGNPIQRGVRRR